MFKKYKKISIALHTFNTIASILGVGLSLLALKNAKEGPVGPRRYQGPMGAKGDCCRGAKGVRGREGTCKSPEGL